MVLPKLLAVGGLIALFAGCSAPPDTRAPELSVAPQTVWPGGSFTVHGAGVEGLSGDRLAELKAAPMTMSFQPGGRVLTIGHLTLDDEGGFSETVTVPADAQPGRWNVSWDVPCHDTNASCVGIAASFTVAG